MVKQYTQEELESRYRKLPEILKDALLNVEVANKILETGKKYGLPAQKISKLAGEVGYVILGLTKPQEFAPNLSQILEIDADKSKEIAKDINHLVFFPLREALKKTHEMDLTEEEIERGAAAVKPPPAPIPQPPPVRPPVPPRPFTPTPQPVLSKPPVPPPPPLPKASADAKALADRSPDAAPPVFPQKIVLEKKPEPPAPPPKIPPIDLRNQKPPVPQPAPPTALPPRNTKYEGVDPYREPPEQK